FVGLYPSTLYMTETWGDNWNVSYTPPHGSFWIEDIAIFKQNPQLMYFGTGRNVLNHGLFKSIDGGLSWIKISDPGQIVSIALHPTSPETVFVASYVKIQVSYNGGTSFEEVGQSIPSNDISKIIVNLNNPSKLIVGTKDKGVFYTLNSGQSWKPASGLYDPRVTDIHLILTMKSIFIGAHGSGIWQGYDVVSNIDRKNNPIDAHQVFSFLPTYPNPFNTQTTISFDLSERKEIELNIYNLQGQLIKKLVKNTFLAGKHQIQWNGTDEQNRPVVNGIYFIRLHSNTQDATAKLILLK
ncbi:MAG: T9SS type A sorting domain-containing protein, partial [bacterium]